MEITKYEVCKNSWGVSGVWGVYRYMLGAFSNKLVVTLPFLYEIVMSIKPTVLDLGVKVHVIPWNIHYWF